MRLASHNSWAQRRLKHLKWRSQWIHCDLTFEQKMEVSREISRANRCLFGLSSWLSTRSSTATRRMRSTASWLRDNCTRLSDSLQHTVDVSKFPTLVGQFTQQPSCTIVLWQIERISIRIASSWEISWLCLIFYWYLGIDSFPRYSRYTK